MSNSESFNAGLNEFLSDPKLDHLGQDEFMRINTEFNGKLNTLVLESVRRSSLFAAEQTAKTIQELTEVSKSISDSAELSAAMPKFINAQVEIARANASEYTAIAQRIQRDVFELMADLGREFAEQTNRSTKKP